MSSSARFERSQSDVASDLPSFKHVPHSETAPLLYIDTQPGKQLNRYLSILNEIQDEIKFVMKSIQRSAGDETSFLSPPEVELICQLN